MEYCHPYYNNYPYPRRLYNEDCEPFRTSCPPQKCYKHKRHNNHKKHNQDHSLKKKKGHRSKHHHESDDDDSDTDDSGTDESGTDDSGTDDSVTDDSGTDDSEDTTDDSADEEDNEKDKQKVKRKSKKIKELKKKIKKLKKKKNHHRHEVEETDFDPPENESQSCHSIPFIEKEDNDECSTISTTKHSTSTECGKQEDVFILSIPKEHRAMTPILGPNAANQTCIRIQRNKKI